MACIRPGQATRTVSRFTVFAAAALLLAACGSSEHPAGDASPSTTPAAGTTVPLADGSDAAVAKVVQAVTTFPTQLDPRIWNGMQMKPDVRARSMQIVDRLVASMGIKDLAVNDVELFGSNASYEWDDKSDFGVHIFVQSPSMTTDQLTPVLNALNDDVERRQEGRVLFYGVPVEITFHAGRTEKFAAEPGVGQYSISTDSWVEKPSVQPDNFDRAQMTTDLKTFIGKYNTLASEYEAAKQGFDCSRFGALDNEMAAYRNDAFAKGLGSRSTPNLTYRALRRINISIPDMVDTLEDDCTFFNESLH
jgi:hypothetical protein